MEKGKAKIWFLLIPIIIFISECLVSFLPSFICFLAFVLLYILSFLFFAYFFAGFIVTLKSIKEDKKTNIIYGVCAVMLLFSLFYSYGIHIVIHNYSLADKFLKENFGNNYHIKGLYKEENPFYSWNTCDSIFEVYLDDSIDVTFEVGNCTSSSSWLPNHEEITNYGEKYIKYYYDEYNKNHPVNFIIEKGDDLLTIKYKNSDIGEVYDFIEYVKSKLVYNHVKINFYNEETSRLEQYGFWNNFDLLLY